jgi:hypothetical protein
MIQFPKFTFPDDDHLPTIFLEVFQIPFVTGDIVSEFLLPEFHTRSGIRGIFATLVTMPETAMHEDNSSMLWQNNIGIARKVASVKTESESQTVE